MKKTELRKLVVEYNFLKLKLRKKYERKLAEKLKAIEHRYYHETGEKLL